MIININIPANTITIFAQVGILGSGVENGASCLFMVS